MAASIKLIVVFCLMSLVSISVYAQTTKVVVIPMAGDDLTPLKNVISVAKADGDFDNPVAAMASISDAGASNPYLVVIGPGEYPLTETLVMQEYVEIAGSGRNATMLTGEISSGDPSTSALVKGVNNAGIHSLSIENKGGSKLSIGIYNTSSSPRMSDMSITASGGTDNYGVYNEKASSPTMSDMRITASGGTIYNYGVFNSTSSSPRMSDMSITASGGTGNNLGVYNEGASSPTMSDMSITASGGTNNRGVHNWISSSPTMSDMSITASGGTNNNGVLNHDSSSTMSDMSITAFGGSSENFGVYNRNDASYARIRKSTISASGGTNNSVVAQNGSGSKETYISDSILTGDVTGSPVCSFTFDIDGTDLTAGCTP